MAAETGTGGELPRQYSAFWPRRKGERQPRPATRRPPGKIPASAGGASAPLPGRGQWRQGGRDRGTADGRNRRPAVKGRLCHGRAGFALPPGRPSVREYESPLSPGLRPWAKGSGDPRDTPHPHRSTPDPALSRGLRCRRRPPRSQGRRGTGPLHPGGSAPPLTPGPDTRERRRPPETAGPAGPRRGTGRPGGGGAVGPSAPTRAAGRRRR